jgi:AcrR family transcriptional regulator
MILMSVLFFEPFAMPMTTKSSCAFEVALDHQSQGSQKRERTRSRLKQAGCRLLKGQPLSALRVADICAEAEVAHGTFYLYFRDQHAFLTELLDSFVAYLQEEMQTASRAQSSDPVRAATSAYYRLFIANAGLMKCLVNHLDDFPEARKAFQKLNMEWADRIVKSVENQQLKSGKKARLPRDELMRRAYALGGMVDQYLTSLVLNKDQTLISISRDPEAVIDCLSGIWKRGMAA